jgi:hypothetical protein
MRDAPRVAVVMGGPSAEHPVSLQSGRGVVEARGLEDHDEGGRVDLSILADEMADVAVELGDSLGQAAHHLGPLPRPQALARHCGWALRRGGQPRHGGLGGNGLRASGEDLFLTAAGAIDGDPLAPKFPGQ